MALQQRSIGGKLVPSIGLGARAIGDRRLSQILCIGMNQEQQFLTIYPERIGQPPQQRQRWIALFALDVSDVAGFDADHRGQFALRHP